MLLKHKVNLKKVILVIILFFILKLYHLFQCKDTIRTNLSFRVMIRKKDAYSENSQNTKIIKFLKPYCNCHNINEYIMIQKSLDSFNNSFYYILASFVQVTNNSNRDEKNKRVVFKGSLDELKREKVTCDVYNVLKRGKNQRVIAYSLYGTNKIYYEQLQLIIEQIRVKYKNFTVRIYYDKSVNETLRCYFECKYPDVVDFCDVNHFSTNVSKQIGVEEYKNTDIVHDDLSYMHKMMWRFIPVGDTFLDVFMSRDTDSFILDREIDSTKEWLNSSNIAHIMRGSKKKIFIIFYCI